MLLETASLSSQSDLCAAIVANVSPICTNIPDATASSLTDSPQLIAFAIAVIAVVSSSEFILQNARIIFSFVFYSLFFFWDEGECVFRFVFTFRRRCDIME